MPGFKSAVSRLMQEKGVRLVFTIERGHRPSIGQILAALGRFENMARSYLLQLKDDEWAMRTHYQRVEEFKRGPDGSRFTIYIMHEATPLTRHEASALFDDFRKAIEEVMNMR